MAYPIYPTYPTYFGQQMPDYRMMAQAQAQAQAQQNQQINQPQQMPQQPTQMQQTMPMQSMAQGISAVSRAVTNKEEAMAAQIPFDGSVSVFTDIPHGKIYTKTFNFNDGSSIFKTYSVEADDEVHDSETSKETAKSFASADALAALEQRIVALENRKPTIVEKTVEKRTERPTERDKNGRYVSKKREVIEDEYDEYDE